MKSNKILAFGLMILAIVSCGKKTAQINGVVKDAPESEVIVKLLNVNTYKVLDTIKTKADGSFSYKAEVAEGQPEFIYLFHGNTKIASLLLQTGDKVSVAADTLGNYSVEGSEESLKLKAVEDRFSAFIKDFARISAPVDGGDLTDAQAAAINSELTKTYIAYYRQSVAYIMENAKSLTSIPVLFQNVNANFPIFNQATDAIHFRNVADSLKTVYPESKYVKALEKEANARINSMAIGSKIQSAPEMGYPDLNMPDVNGKKVALSSLDSKVILVHFWSSADAAHKMFNIDTLLPVYEQYHGKGFEVYSIAVDTDKSAWGASVKTQNLPWINVCDGNGSTSIALGLYNVVAVPTSYLIVNGKLSDEKIANVDDLKRFLARTL